MTRWMTLATLAVLTTTPALAQPEMTWRTIDAGGGESSGGGFVMHGTTGQPDAGFMAGGGFVMHGGFVFGVDTGFCYADCDGSTGRRVLDVFDFLCFGNRFAVNDPYACDCDLSTGGGVCDIFDFLCFQNAFAAGCE